jgi:hypothetical protein
MAASKGLMMNYNYLVSGAEIGSTIVGLVLNLSPTSKMDK